MIAALLEAHGVSGRRLPLAARRSRWSRAGPDRRRRDRRRRVRGRGRARRRRRPSRRTGRSTRARPVTQFEAATAAAFVALAAAGVEVGVIEAGLGGRLDATNVIPSRVTALTSVGLDHTEWLGDTEEEIAAEKLAVLRDHSTLVLGELGPEVARAGRANRGRARRAARPRAGTPARGSAARARRASSAATSPSPCAAAEAILGELDPRPVARGRRRARPSRPARAASPATRRRSSTPPTTRTAPRRSPRRCPRSPASGRSSPASASSPTRTPRAISRRWRRRSSTRSAPSSPPARAAAVGGRARARSAPRAGRASARTGWRLEAEAIAATRRGGARRRAARRAREHGWRRRSPPVRTTFCEDRHGPRRHAQSFSR